jgi:hypothetical protein
MNAIVIAAKNFLDGQPNIDSHFFASESLREQLLNNNDDSIPWRQFKCDVCVDRETGLPKILNGNLAWDLHLKSKKHHKAVSSLRRRQERELMLKNREIPIEDRDEV